MMFNGKISFNWFRMKLIRFNRLKNEKFREKMELSEEEFVQTTGYLNYLTSFIDNFTYGAAIGGRFAVSSLIGLITLAGIIIHDIPHEMGDFAILLRSGFDRQQATKAQLITSLGAFLGASIATDLFQFSWKYFTFHVHYFFDIHWFFFSSDTLWVIPFTSGGFLYVALVKTLPDLLKENDLK